MADSFYKSYHPQQSFTKAKRWASSSTSAFLSIFFVLLFVAVTFILNWVDLSKITSTSFLKAIAASYKKEEQTVTGLNSLNETFTNTYLSPPPPSPPSCPEYFRWIHEDLKPWKSTGITRDMVETGKNMSHFRLVILKGRAYVKKYDRAFQTRDVFTIWGISQLLRLYPGKLPDLELLFQCGDRTVVKKSHFKGAQGEEEASMAPPPMFHYCGRDDSFDIAFPDWSFWGWAELNIRPWDTILQKIQEGNKKIKWKDRVPYAFWKGNSRVAPVRNELTKCNASDQHDWNARIYPLRWDQEIGQKFKNTKLEDQCAHRYKIYVEGVTWSVSEKYILACDSMTMFIEPAFYDFFSRSLVPLQHYWPISVKNMCQDIKFAVDWGNSHSDKAQAIGKEGTKFLQENLKMKLVYDYMFHLLSEYARLLRFKPTIPEGATELCSDTVDCPMNGVVREFMEESMVKSPSATPPCALPPPYEPQALQKLLQRKEGLIKQAATGVAL